MNFFFFFMFLCVFCLIWPYFLHVRYIVTYLSVYKKLLNLEDPNKKKGKWDTNDTVLYPPHWFLLLAPHLCSDSGGPVRWRDPPLPASLHAHWPARLRGLGVQPGPATTNGRGADGELGEPGVGGERVHVRGGGGRQGHPKPGQEAAGWSSTRTGHRPTSST